MIKSLKLFAGCVESLRTAEKAYEENDTPANKRNVIDLQAKVDAWIKWVHQQEDAGLARKIPPFIPSKHSFKNPPKLPSTDSVYVIDYYLMEKLKENHTQDEINRFSRLMQGYKNISD